MSMSLRKKKKKNKVIKSLVKRATKKPPKINVNEFNEMINKKETDIKSELFQKHFSFQRPSEMLKAVYSTNNRRKNKKLVNMIKGRLSDLKNEI